MPSGFHLTSSSEPQEDVISNYKRFQGLLQTQSQSLMSSQPMSSSDRPSKRKRLGWWTPPSQPEHISPWSLPRRKPLMSQPPSQPQPPATKQEDDGYTPMHQPAGATSTAQQPVYYHAQHAEPITIRFRSITALTTPAIPLPSAPPPAYFTSTQNTTTQPIAPEYAGYTNTIVHHLENLTMAYRRNSETSLPIGEYIRQIEVQQLAQETIITNLVNSMRATRETVKGQTGRFRQMLDAGRYLEELLDQRVEEVTDLVESGACQCRTQAHQEDQIAVLNGTVQSLTMQLDAMTKQQKDTQKTLDRAISLFNKQHDHGQQLESMLNQVLIAVNSQLVNPPFFQQPTKPDDLQIKMEEWEKKLDQILQGSAPPPPPPAPAPVPIPSALKIPAPAPYNGTAEDVSLAVNCICQYAAILIGQYPDMRLGDLVHQVLILLQHSSTTQWIDEARLRYFNSMDPNALMTLFLKFEMEFDDRMKQEKARKWITL
ncbi:hypothetical protein AX16_009057 [Volvariella volvacea WC 439]|nr:hypothetical protein AX16_009057 [Volvariella volvacea WC 439]